MVGEAIGTEGEEDGEESPQARLGGALAGLLALETEDRVATFPARRPRLAQENERQQ